MAVISAPPILQFSDDNGVPLAGGKVYTYAAGTTTPLASYTDAGGATPAANPITLDGGGFIPASNNNQIWLNGSYNLRVTSADGTFDRTTPNVTSFSAPTSDLQASAFVPTGATVPTNGMYLASANTLGFATNGVVRVTIDPNGVVAITGGVKPGNTSVVDTNTLDWYQEGTFTPVLIGLTAAGTGTYVTQNGRYTRIGNVVNYAISLWWTAHTGTGNAAITGLPFPPLTDLATNILNSSYATVASSFLQAQLAAANNRIDLFQVVIASGSQTPAPIDTAAIVYISGSYFV